MPSSPLKDRANYIGHKQGRDGKQSYLLIMRKEACHAKSDQPWVEKTHQTRENAPEIHAFEITTRVFVYKLAHTPPENVPGFMHGFEVPNERFVFAFVRTHLFLLTEIEQKSAPLFSEAPKFSSLFA